MADAAAARPYPNPPDFWREFDETGNTPYPEPPPIPTTTYRSLGQTHQVSVAVPSPSEAGINQLFPLSALPAGVPSPTTDSQWSLTLARELNKLVHSVLLNFVELCGILAKNPAQAEAKVNDIRDLFNNMHFLVNSYRPHQARETLIGEMEGQVSQGHAEIRKIGELSEKFMRILKEMEEPTPGALQRMESEAQEALAENETQGGPPSERNAGRKRKNHRDGQKKRRTSKAKYGNEDAEMTNGVDDDANGDDDGDEEEPSESDDWEPENESEVVWKTTFAALGVPLSNPSRKKS